MGSPCNSEYSALALSDIAVETAGYPSLGHLGSELFVAFQVVQGDLDEVVVGAVQDGGLERHRLCSGRRSAHQPVLFQDGDALCAAWCELDAYRSDLYAATYDHRQWGAARLLATSEGIESLCAVQDGAGRALLLWAQQAGTKSDIWCVHPNVPDEHPRQVTFTGSAYRPAACVAKDGRLWVSCDQFDGQNYYASVTFCEGAQFAPPRLLRQPDHGWATSAVVSARDSEGVDVFWYAINRGAKLRFWRSQARVNSGRIVAEDPATWAEGRNWYAGLRMRAAERGDLMAYNWGRQIHVRTVSGGLLGQPMMVSRPHTDDFNRRADVLLLPDGRMAIAFQRAPGNGHHERHSEIVLRMLDAYQRAAATDPGAEAQEDPFVQPPERQRGVISLAPEEHVQFRAQNPAYGSLQVLWGDIHGQNTLSDALGEMDQYYRFAWSQAELDFVALTNHDVFPDELTPSEWEISKRYARVFNQAGHLVTLQALEWTSNEYRHDFGHKNLYFQNEDPPLYRSSDNASDTPEKLFALLAAGDALCFPHHPAADWGVVSAATDWHYHDERVQRAVEIFSRHAPFEYHGNRSPYTRNVAQFTGRSARDALGMGYTLAFTGGSDTHQLEHGIEGGLVAVYATEHSRQAVFEALLARRIYATSGARILLSLHLGATLMGQKARVETGRLATFDLRATGTKEIETVELIRNGESVWREHPNQRHIAYEVSLDGPTSSEPVYVYLKVTQTDSHMAWSSPIWLVPSADV